jgi:hypothetical protein
MMTESEPETKRIFDEAPRFASSWTEARRGEAGFLIISRSEARRGTILNHQSKRGEVRREEIEARQSKVKRDASANKMIFALAKISFS